MIKRKEKENGANVPNHFDFEILRMQILRSSEIVWKIFNLMRTVNDTQVVNFCA